MWSPFSRLMRFTGKLIVIFFGKTPQKNQVTNFFQLIFVVDFPIFSEIDFYF
jgi:hypothetical protein